MLSLIIYLLECLCFCSLFTLICICSSHSVDVSWLIRKEERKLIQLPLSTRTRIIDKILFFFHENLIVIHNLEQFQTLSTASAMHSLLLLFIPPFLCSSLSISLYGCVCVSNINLKNTQWMSCNFRQIFENNSFECWHNPFKVLQYNRSERDKFELHENFPIVHYWNGQKQWHYGHSNEIVPSTSTKGRRNETNDVPHYDSAFQCICEQQHKRRWSTQ